MPIRTHPMPAVPAHNATGASIAGLALDLTGMHDNVKAIAITEESFFMFLDLKNFLSNGIQIFQNV